MNRNYRYEFHKTKIDKLRSSIIKSCKKCNGEGYIPTGNIINKNSFEFDDCRCKKKFNRLKEYIVSNIPKRRFNLIKTLKKKGNILNTLTNEKISLYNVVIRKYLKNFNKIKKDGLGLMFFGTPGSGKTTASIFIIIKLIKNNKDCYYIYFKDLIGLLMQSYDDKSKGPLFKEIISVDFLVIDELSLVSRVTPHMVAEFTSICKQRFEDEKPTLLVSNYYTTEEIFHNFGAPMESLLMEAFIPLKFSGRDLREDKYEYLKKMFE